jgi:hypothetical protein
MSQDVLAQAMLDQVRRALTMFREATQAFPAEEWRAGDLDYLRPAGVAYHVVETIDFYGGDQSADQFPWGARFGVSWEDARSERLPLQQQVLAYLDDVEAELEMWLVSADLSAPEQAFPWTGPIQLARAAYVLRHTQHHVAEMSLELTRRGYPAPAWR